MPHRGDYCLSLHKSSGPPNSDDMLASQHISTTDNGIIHAINREERLSIMEMKKIAFFDTKPYNKKSFGRYAAEQDAVASRVAPQRDRHIASGVPDTRGTCQHRYDNAQEP